MKALVCWLACVSTVVAQATLDPTSLGQRLYRRGVSTTGTPLEGTVQGDLRVRGTEMPCTNCHRRSGWGTSEGPVTVPPVIGRVLFAPLTKGTPQIAVRTTGAGTRPAYTESTLLAAIRDGIDPAGRKLSPTMPRYQVSEGDVAALASYLRTLSAEPPPGVTATSIHFATIVTPEVSAERRASVLSVLNAFVRAKNAGTRYESRRRERGPWDMRQHYELYREWILHEWALRGSPAEWPAQLEEWYRREPVFAVLGGISDDDWTPVHEFSTRHGIPVVLPQAPLPPSQAAEPFYSLYFSRGAALEAQTLAHTLQPSGPRNRVLQLSRCNSPGSEAASRLVAEAPLAMRVRSECFDAPSTLAREQWREILSRGENVLILWFDRRDLAGVKALGAAADLLTAVSDIYLSSSLLGEAAREMPGTLASRASLVNTFVAPAEFEQHAWRTLAWFRANGLAPTDRIAAVDAFFAATLLGDVLAMPRTLDSREYFIERIEHMTGRSPQRSAYPALAFDAKHRFASSFCRIVKLTEPDAAATAKAGSAAAGTNR